MTHSIQFSVVEQASRLRGVDTGPIKDLLNRKDLQSPVLLLSRREIGRNFDALRDALPRVNIHYAVKPNNHEVVIREVHLRGGNFDVCSAGEIIEVAKTGLNPASLVHSHPVKSIPEFDFAVGKGVEIFVVDNIEEIKKNSTHKFTEVYCDNCEDEFR